MNASLLAQTRYKINALKCAKLAKASPTWFICTYLESEPRSKGPWVGASICNPLILVGHVVEFPGKDTKFGQVSQTVFNKISYI